MATIELTDEQVIHVRRALYDEVNCLSHAVANCVTEDAACHRRSRGLLLEVISNLESNAMRHTPGPWHSHFSGSIAEQSDGEYGGATGIITNSESAFFQDGDRGDLVAWVPHDGHHVANASLIAAAPDLMDVCKRIRDDLLNIQFTNGFWKMDKRDARFIVESLQYAIDRAEGRHVKD